MGSVSGNNYQTTLHCVFCTFQQVLSVFCSTVVWHSWILWLFCFFVFVFIKCTKKSSNKSCFLHFVSVWSSCKIWTLILFELYSTMCGDDRKNFFLIYEDHASFPWTCLLALGRRRRPSGPPSWNVNQWSVRLHRGSVQHCQRWLRNLPAQGFSQTGKRLQKIRNRERSVTCVWKQKVCLQSCVLFWRLLKIVVLQSERQGPDFTPTDLQQMQTYCRWLSLQPMWVTEVIKLLN